MVADRKPTRAQLRKKYRVSEKWDALFKLIPNYDPYAQAGDCHFDEGSAENPGDHPGTAEYVCHFSATCIKHVKSTNAVPAGTLFVLRDWQKAFVGCLFGWKRPDGRRRYRECFLFIPKKNGKSALAAMLIIYILTQDGEAAAELFSAAATKEQCRNIFDHVKGMIKAQPRFYDKTGGFLTIYGDRGGSTTKSVMYPAMGSSYICLPSDARTIDGPSVHCAVMDEVHRYNDPELQQVLKKSSRARPQPILLYATTSDYDRPSICNTLLDKAHSVQKNKGNPAEAGFFPDFLPVVYEASIKDDFLDPEVHARANPNLNVTIEAADLLADAKEAAEIPSELNAFLRLNLNIKTDAKEVWITKKMWDACKDDIGIESLRGRPCWAGLDLASTSDMTAFVMLFPLDDERIFLWPHFWVPEPLLEPRSHKNWNLYCEWKRAGLLDTTPTIATDYAYIRKAINKWGQQFGIRDIGVDKLWQGEQLAGELENEDGFKVTPFGQGYVSMAMPTEKFETRVKAHTVIHDGNKLLAWQASNCMVKLDSAGNKKLDKEASCGKGGKTGKKIDGMVCAVMALGVWGLAEGVSEPVVEVIY